MEPSSSPTPKSTNSTPIRSPATASFLAVDVLSRASPAVSQQSPKEGKLITWGGGQDGVFSLTSVEYVLRCVCFKFFSLRPSYLIYTHSPCLELAAGLESRLEHQQPGASAPSTPLAPASTQLAPSTPSVQSDEEIEEEKPIDSTEVQLIRSISCYACKLICSVAHPSASSCTGAAVARQSRYFACAHS